MIREARAERPTRTIVPRRGSPKPALRAQGAADLKERVERSNAADGAEHQAREVDGHRLRTGYEGSGTDVRFGSETGNAPPARSARTSSSPPCSRPNCVSWSVIPTSESKSTSPDSRVKVGAYHASLATRSQRSAESTLKVIGPRSGSRSWTPNGSCPGERPAA